MATDPSAVVFFGRDQGIAWREHRWVPLAAGLEWKTFGRSHPFFAKKPRILWVYGE
jgi:hypothetical protein